MRFLVHREEEFFLEGEELFLARVLVKRELGFVDRLALFRILHHAEELLVARLAEFHFEHEPAAFFGLVLVESFLRFARQPVAEHVLLSHQLIDQRLEPIVLMGRDRGRAADDERRARFVDQDGIDFVDDRVVIAALHLLFARGGHAVVAQVIETELGVRPVGDVHGVLLAAEIGRLIVLDAAAGQTEEAVELAHPFGVAAGEVIVHRHEMRAAAGERVKIERQRGDERFAFAGRHFRDPPAMQNDAADQLHIEVHHVPRHRLIADRESILALGQAARGVFHHRKGFRQNLVEPAGERLGIFDRGELGLPGGGFGAQIVVRERLKLLVESVDRAHDRLQALDLALIFRAEYFL